MATALEFPRLLVQSRFECVVMNLVDYTAKIKEGWTDPSLPAPKTKEQ